MPKPASQAKTLGQANKLTSQKDSGVCLNPLSVQCPGVGTFQELTNCHRPGQLRHANRVVARGRWPKHALWAAAIQTRGQDIRARAWGKCLLQETLVLWRRAEGDHEESAWPSRSLERINVSSLWSLLYLKFK